MIDETEPTQCTCAPVVGIDPGAQGAIALLSPGSLLTVPMPVREHRTTRGKVRLRTDGAALASKLLWLRAWGAQIAFVEAVWGIKRQGAGSAAALGHAMGCIETACAAADLDMQLVSPLRWKYDLGILKRGKSGAVDLAARLFPDSAKDFVPVRGEVTSASAEGAAEAALIAEWGRRQLVAGLVV